MHALTYGDRHGKVWRRVYKQLGGNGQRCGKSMCVKKKWRYTCPNGHSAERHRRMALHSRWACGRCHGKLTCTKI